MLLALVLAALVYDIGLRSRPVHAQSPVTVTGIVGFQCDSGRCYVLSK